MKVKQYRKILLLVLMICAAILFGCVERALGRQLSTQQIASEWSAEDSYAQISCFFSKDAAVTKDYVIQLEQKLKTALQEASEDTSDVNGRTLVDCYSTKGELTLYSDRASITARAFGVGGDFFTFHPLKLLSGSYFDGEDLNKDGVVIDENVAWQLFGSNNVAGMYVEINGVQYPVRGVVKSDKGYFSDAADEEEAQPMGALHDYVAVDPVTERSAVVNFPVCKDNIYKIDVEETKKVIERYRPEFIIFGKSMVLHKEPVAAIRQFGDPQGIPATIMYDMAHVMGLVGDHFQKPFEEGAEIVTGSTHKTFFGPQRGVIGVNYKPDELKYGLWKTIETRAFPGSVSNHHLGTQLGLLMAAYEMNHFKDAYQSAVIENAKYFARCLKENGLDVAGDPAIDYTETHQVIVSVGYGAGPEVAERLERCNIIVNYQATPDNEGFTASGALRMGVNEMTRFGFGKEAFARLAELMADCILRCRDVTEDVERLRSQYTQMHYCFDGAQMHAALEEFATKTGV